MSQLTLPITPMPEPPPPVAAPAASPAPMSAGAFGDTLRRETCAVRLHHEKLGVRRALTREQVGRAAAPFSASAEALSASKRILDTAHPAYRKVVSIRRQATQFWKAMSVPYPEAGTRLIKRDRVVAFNKQMVDYRTALEAAAAELQEAYAGLRQRARETLGDLFNAGDYPTRVDDEFALAWDYPSIEPPQYLKQVHPELYQQECDRIRVRFEEAVRLTEQAFVTQLHELVAHLAEKLKGDADGKPLRFRDSAVGKLTDFFEAFKGMNVGSSAELDKVVEQAKQVVAGVTPDDLRDSAETRARVQAQLAEIRSSLDTMMVDRPRRQYDLEDQPTAATGADASAAGGPADSQEGEAA